MANIQKANTQMAAKQPVKSVKALATTPAYVNRFAEVLGGQDKANQFLANVISAVNVNRQLQACDPGEIMQCAMTAAALNLDVVPGLGFAAIVPYKKNDVMHPQFQIMKNGFVQLAMRSNQVQTINVTDVYEDELKSYDRLTGSLSLIEVPGGQRDKGEEDKIVGYACYVKLLNGFEKVVYWEKKKVVAHALRYSQAYQYDKRFGKASSPWSTNFSAMAEKTVIKSTIGKWVPMSTQMMMAQKADQSTQQVINVGENGEIEAIFEYGDNEENGADFEVEPDISQSTQSVDKEPQAQPDTLKGEEITGPGPESFDDGEFRDTEEDF